MSLELLAQKISEMQTTKASFLFFATTLILLASAFGIFFLLENVEPSLEKVLPDTIQEIKTMNAVRSEFGADMIYILITPEYASITNEQVTTYTTLLKQKIETNPLVISVIDQKPNLSIESSYRVLFIQTDVGSSAKRISQLISELEFDIRSLENQNPGTSSKITGSAAIDKATFETIIFDFVKITAISMFGVFIVVFLTFRNIKKTILALTVVGLSLMTTMGVVGYLHLTITVVTMVAAAMIIGLGIDFGIHVVLNYSQLRKKHSPKESIFLLNEELVRAMLGASLTTIAGFLSLLFGIMPAMKILGIVLAIGIFTTLLSAMLFLPALMYELDRRNIL